jgi:putative effector of murein hydrolase
MIPPAGMAIAALTLMLWILWSDTVRPRRPRPILYALRIAAYLIMTGMLVLNRIRYPSYFSAGSTVLVILTACVGVGGAVYFVHRLATRT